MSTRIPFWFYVVFGLQFLLALFFFFMGLSMTAAFSQGRPTALVDVLVMASPAVAVVLCAGLAVFAWRNVKRALTAVLAIMPIPVSFVLFGVVGAI